MSWQCEGDEVASVPLQVTISSFPEAREFRRRLLDAVLGVGAIEKEGQDCGSKMNALNQVSTEDTYIYIHSSRSPPRLRGAHDGTRRDTGQQGMIAA